VTNVYNIWRTRWPRRLRRGSAAARCLGLWVWIKPGSIEVCVLWVMCVLSCRGLCVGLITRPEESYRAWCVLSVIAKPLRGGHYPESGRSAAKKMYNIKKDTFKMVACDISLCVNKWKESIWPHNRVFIRRYNL